MVDYDDENDSEFDMYSDRLKFSHSLRE